MIKVLVDKHGNVLEKGGKALGCSYTPPTALTLQQLEDRFSCGQNHVIVRKPDGTCVSWGTRAPNVSSWTGVTKVVAGAWSGMGLKSDGTVFCAGTFYGNEPTNSGVLDIALGGAWGRAYQYATQIGFSGYTLETPRYVSIAAADVASLPPVYYGGTATAVLMKTGAMKYWVGGGVERNLPGTWLSMTGNENNNFYGVRSDGNMATIANDEATDIGFSGMIRALPANSVRWFLTSDFRVVLSNGTTYYLETANRYIAVKTFDSNNQNGIGILPDGTVEHWGANPGYGETNVPEGLKIF